LFSLIPWISLTRTKREAEPTPTRRSW